jgi:hypothetical protein
MSQVSRSASAVGGVSTSYSPIRRSAVTINLDAWKGRLTFDAKNGRGWRVGTVVVDVDLAELTITYGTRKRAVIDRGDFRDWLLRPGSPLPVDDVVWKSEADGIYIVIGGLTYAVPDFVVQRLDNVI